MKIKDQRHEVFAVPWVLVARPRVELELGLLHVELITNSTWKYLISVR